MGVDFIGYPAMETVAVEDRAMLTEAVMKCHANPHEVHCVRFRKVAKDAAAAVSYSDWELHAQLDENGDLRETLIIGRENSANDLQFELLSSLSDTFYVISPEFIIEKAHVAANTIQTDPNDVEGNPINSILPPTYHDIATEAVRTICNDGKSFEFDYSRGEASKVNYFHVQLVPMAFQGKVHALWIEKDVTLQKTEQKKIDDSLQDIRHMWDSMPVLFHSLNKNWEIDYANHKWEEVFKLEKKDYLNKNFWEVFPDVQGTEFEGQYRKAMDQGVASLNNDFYVASLDNWYTIDIYPWLNGAAVYVRDISDRMQLELREKQMELKLTKVWESIIDGYLLLDVDWSITYANPAWKSMFGKEHTEIVGKSFYSLFPEIKGHSFNKVLVDAKQSGEVKRELVYFESNDIWVNAVVYPSEDGLAVNMQDVSSQEKMKSAMSDLSFMTSHELRHEYAKLHSVINLLSVSNEDEKFLLKEAHKSLIQINSLISVMNDKLTFNRDNSSGRLGNDWMEFEEAILIDDDHVINFINARVIRLMFPGSRVKSFVNAEKALSYLKEFDKMGKKLVFIDLNMPGFDGWDFLESYRHLPIKSPVYILTSSINPKDIERSMQFAEVVKFLTKPLSSDLLESERIRPVEFKG